MGEKLGVERQTLYDVLSTSTARLGDLDADVPDARCGGGAAARAMASAGLRRQTDAERPAPFPIGRSRWPAPRRRWVAAATAAYAMHISNGHGDLDMSSIVKLINPDIQPVGRDRGRRRARAALR